MIFNDQMVLSSDGGVGRTSMTCEVVCMQAAACISVLLRQPFNRLQLL